MPAVAHKVLCFASQETEFLFSSFHEPLSSPLFFEIQAAAAGRIILHCALQGNISPALLQQFPLESVTFRNPSSRQWLSLDGYETFQYLRASTWHRLSRPLYS